MYISLEWLKDYLPLPDNIDVTRLENSITTSIAEVESWHAIGQDRIVVGKIILLERHPKADRLQLVRVSIGTEEITVVCGGTNLREEMFIVFARVGAKVKWHGEGDWIVLEKAVIRGIESCGMICASNELELPLPCKDSEITDITAFVTDKDLGRNVYDVLGVKDVIFEIENKSLTNRPDLFGHYGIARDMYAVLSEQDQMVISLLPYSQKEFVFGETQLSITVENPLCRRYTGVKVSHVKVQESPLWLQKRLEKIGIRPINNLVDITNYVMVDLGQPLHAFDATCLENDEIIVRLAKENETILALDGKMYPLVTSDLVIADSKNPVALAGIIGGEYFSINPNTTSIIFEAASFDPAIIRKTAQRLNCRSESSSRFEKNLDPEYTIMAINRALQLLQESCPNMKIESALSDHYNVKIPIKNIVLRTERVMKKIGIMIPFTSIQNILIHLGFVLQKITETTIEVIIPSWRATKDIEHEDDLIEEIARIYGYSRIPISPPLGALVPTDNKENKFEMKIRNHFAVRLGYFETMHYPFTTEKENEVFGRGDLSLLGLKNVLSSEQTHMKTSLFAGLLKGAKDNIHQFDSFKLFEMGRIFGEEKDVVIEKKKIGGIVIMPKRKKINSFDNIFYEVKKDLETLFTLLHLDQRRYVSKDIFSFLTSGQQSTIVLKGQDVGILGILDEQQKIIFDLEMSDVILFELDQMLLFIDSGNDVLYKVQSKFPHVTRDFAFVVNKNITVASIENSIYKADNNIVNVELFDVYEGAKIDNENRSVAFNVTYQNPNKTLEEKEIEEITVHLVTVVVKMGGELRDV